MTPDEVLIEIKLSSSKKTNKHRHSSKNGSCATGHTLMDSLVVDLYCGDKKNRTPSLFFQWLQILSNGVIVGDVAN